MLAVLAPIHDPSYWPSILEQYNHQVFEDRCLIVVANGCPPLDTGFEALYYEYSPHKLGPGAARNRCLKAARWLDVEKFAFFDCDDLYDPEYLSEIDYNLSFYAACGKGEFPLRNELTGDIVAKGEGSADSIALRGLTGGTLAGWTKHAVPFNETLNTGEDCCWCHEMRARGHVLRSTSKNHYMKRYFGPNAGHTHPTAPVWC